MKKITLPFLLGFCFLATSNLVNASGIDPTKPLKKTTATFATANDDCANAIAITTFPYSFLQADGAEAANDGTIGTCLNGMNDGLWFSVVGDGNNIMITVTPEDDLYDLQIGIFSGSCSGLECVGTVDDTYEGESESYTIGNTEVGVVYYINVGDNSPIIDGPEANFTIEVDSAEMPVNDNCAGAIEITSFPYSNEQTDGFAASSDGFETTCQDWEINDGLWYTFTGDGTSVLVTVTTGEEYDPAVGVYSGSCEGLECVGAVDDVSSGEESILVETEEGTVYYINIGHYDSFDDMPEGNFTIEVNTAIPPVVPVNDACETATQIASFPFNEEIDATAATNNDGVIEACSGGMNDGIWYSVEGNGSDIVVNATSQGWDAELAIYTGSCGSFECYDSVDDGLEGDTETLTIEASEVGTTYYINFGHWDGSEDDAEGQAIIEVTSEDLGTGENHFKNFTTYPNPVKDVLNLSHTETISNVEVFNLLGQKMLTKAIDAAQGQLELSGLSNGSYLVKVTSGNETKTIKVLKQ